MKDPYRLFWLSDGISLQDFFNKEKSFHFTKKNKSLGIFYILNLFRIPETKNDFAAPKIRNTVLETIKMSSSLESFKSKTR